MAKKDVNAKRRRVLRDQKAARRATFRDGLKRASARQGSTKGYDVPMIRDFLEHLLLEVRVRQSENVQTLRKLETVDMSTAMAETANLASTPAVAEQFKRLITKYETALLGVTVIDGAGAAERDVREFTKALLRRNVQLREEQVTHLEALQELFDEACACAKLPYGFTKDGQLIQLHNIYKVSDSIVHAVAERVPSYDELLPLFRGHSLADSSVVRQLRDAAVIAARIPGCAEHLVILGRDEVERAQRAGETELGVWAVAVDTPEELQFLIAAVRKFCGRLDYHSDPWKAFEAA